MAFMMPVMKNDYNIYASRSRTSSNNSASSGGRRRHTQSESAPVSLSCSPGSDIEERLAAVSLGCSPRRGGSHVALGATDLSCCCPKSASQNSLHKFHHKVVEKLRRKMSRTPREDDKAKASTPVGSS